MNAASSFLKPLLSKEIIQRFKELLESQPAIFLNRLPQVQAELSYRYRHSRPQGFTSALECWAYALTRAPATYAALTSVLNVIDSNTSLTSFLDLGAGPGLSILAVLQKWPSLKEITLIEENTDMISLSQQLLASLSSIKPTYQQYDLKTVTFSQAYDVVLLSYALGELSPDLQLTLLEKAWQSCRKYLILITPGTPSHFRELMMWRRWLVDAGAIIIAPCTHQVNCPLETSKQDWCHFSAHLQRLPWHQRLKKASLNYEEEKYSYLIVEKNSIPSSIHRGRIVRPPLHRSGHVILDLCQGQETSSIQRLVIGKRQKEHYQLATKMRWGEIWE